MPPSALAGKGRAPAALKGAALRAASLHPRLFIVSIVGLPVADILSLSFRMAPFSVPVNFLSAADIPCLFLLTTGDFPDGNRGCHASHRASYAVSARPFGQRVSIPGCRNVNITLAVTLRSRRSHCRRRDCRR
ncbi:hypothetical protein GXA51_22305 [Salmonella enterica]|nr:hypothetical protein [Salmonella enterica]